MQRRRFQVMSTWLFGQVLYFACQITKHIPKHTRMHAYVHTQTVSCLQATMSSCITKMQIWVVRLSCPLMHFEEKTTKWGKTHNESISFNVDRQKDSLIPTLNAFPPQCPAYPPPPPSSALWAKTTGAGKCKPLGGKFSLTAFWCVCDWSVNNEGVSWTTCRADGTAGHQHQTRIRVGGDHAEQQGT